MSRKIIAPSRRSQFLTAHRTLKMASSAHAYVRGSTVMFYKWLEESGSRHIPQGPLVWICGDCHAGNLGPLAGVDGKVHVQIRDLDQTVIGNPNHDLLRLALSYASAARGSDLPGITTAHMLEQMVVGYRRALAQPVSKSVSSDRPQSIKVVVRRATSRTWKHLSRERLRDLKPNIPRGSRFWPLTRDEAKSVKELFGEKSVKSLVTSLKGLPSGTPVQLLDAAYWRKGCSSLGRLRFAALLAVEDQEGEQSLSLMDIKEATSPAAPRASNSRMPNDNAKRVVEGARQLSPALGDRMLPARVLGRSVVIRELMPQDLKVELDKLTREEAVASARYLAEIVGKSHARQMDNTTRREFGKTFKVTKAARLEAPSWLWSSVVELAAAHESAYLEHCRRYALGAH